MEILITIGAWALPVLMGILAILAIAGMKKLLDKWGIERSEKIDDMLDRYVKMGVNTMEVAGTKYLASQGAKMSSGRKKAGAITMVLDELSQSGITDVAEELISNRVEHWLGVEGLNPGVPSDPQSTGEAV